MYIFFQAGQVLPWTYQVYSYIFRADLLPVILVWCKFNFCHSLMMGSLNYWNATLRMVYVLEKINTSNIWHYEEVVLLSLFTTSAVQTSRVVQKLPTSEPFHRDLPTLVWCQDEENTTHRITHSHGRKDLHFFTCLDWAVLVRMNLTVTDFFLHS